MRKYIFILFAAAVSIVQISCKKDQMLSYDFGSGITIYKKAISQGQDSMTVSFAVMDDNILSDTIELPLRIVGQTVNYDRVVNFGIHEEETTAQSENYELLPVYIPANSYEGTLRIRVNKTESLNSKEARIKILLKDSEDFKIGPTEQSSYLLKINNYLTKPATWHDIRFGEYSQAKYGLIIRETGYVNYGDLHPDILIYIVAKCRNYLSLYLQTHGEELEDENGLPVRFP